VQRQSGASEGVFTLAMGFADKVPAQRTENAARRPRSTHAARHRVAAALHWVAALARASARGLSVAAGRLDAWLERRRVAAAALHDFRAMSERELLDIGLTRADVQRVAWGASR
jgi:uncharacterized protein YjiS (DUF1127 family)